MFARFRNLFSKNKNDSEVETEADVSCGMSDSYADDSLKSSEVNGTSEDSSKLEGLNLLKSIVESEQQGQNNGLVAGDKETSASLSEEVAELLKKRLSKGEEKLREDVNGLGESVRNESDIVEENGDHKEESEIICKNEEKLVDNEQVNENDVVPENGGPKKESENIQDSKEHENTEEISNKNEESTNLEQHYEENSSIESSEPTNKVEMENISAPDDNNKTTDELNSNEVKSDEKDSDENEKINKEENEQTFSEATDIEQVNGTNGEPIELHISENEEQKSSSESNDYALQNNVPEILVEKEKNEEVFEENGETKESALENNNEAPELSDEKKENISELCESEELKKSPESNELNLSEKVEDSEQKTSTETEDSSLTNDNKVAELSADKEIINETANIADLKKIQEENSEPKTSEETSPENNNDILEVSDEKKVNISELSNVENLNKTQEPNTQDKVENSEDKTLEETKDSSLENNAEVSELSKENETISPRPLENQVTLENTTSELHEPHENSSEIEPENPIVPTQTQESNAHNESNISDPLNIETNSQDSRDNSPELSDSSKSLSQSSVKEIHANSTSPTPSQDLETNNCNNSSIVVEDLPSEISTPTPTVDSTISIGSSNNSTLASSPVNEIHDPTKIIVNPIDNNGLACNAITNKLTDIAEVAESLDAVIREVQENVQEVEVESNPSPNDKKLGTLRSTSSEDWHSRSTEDDSFATASEGNFTPHSHSSASFLTASGRTSSYISCDKNSFDASEADDSTYNFEMPELTSPLNMSFEGSEQSYLSAQHLNGNLTSEEKDKTPTKLSENSSQTARQLEEDQSSIADIEDLHSESATPTPEDHYDAYHVESIPIESETELEVAGIANAPSLEIITEHTAMPLSKTPEVSPSTSNACSNQNPTNTLMSVNEARDSIDMQEQQNTNNNNNNNNNNKPNAAWRRSSYYENITKQTIKGFL